MFVQMNCITITVPTTNYFYCQFWLSFLLAFDGVDSFSSRSRNTAASSQCDDDDDKDDDIEKNVKDDNVNVHDDDDDNEDKSPSS